MPAAGQVPEPELEAPLAAGLLLSEPPLEPPLEFDDLADESLPLPFEELPDPEESLGDSVLDDVDSEPLFDSEPALDLERDRDESRLSVL